MHMSIKKSNIYQHSCFVPPPPSASPQDTILIEFCLKSCWQKPEVASKADMTLLWHMYLEFLRKLFPPDNAHQRNWASWGCSWRASSICGWRQRQALGWLQGRQVWTYRLRWPLLLFVDLLSGICQIQDLCGWSQLCSSPAKGEHGDGLRPGSGMVEPSLRWGPSTMALAGSRSQGTGVGPVCSFTVALRGDLSLAAPTALSPNPGSQTSQCRGMLSGPLQSGHSGPCCVYSWSARTQCFLLFSCNLLQNPKFPMLLERKMPPNQQSGPYRSCSVSLPKSQVSINLVLDAFSVSDKPDPSVLNSL